MPLDFPISPSPGDIYTLGTRSWQWTGDAWKLLASSSINNTPIGNAIANTGAFTTITASGNITGSGNISGSYFIGNGSALTGITSTPTAIVSGTSNVSVISSGGNVSVGIGGTADIAVFSTAGADITGNITGGNLTTAGLIDATGNITGGNLTTAGLVSATGNITGGNLTTAGLVSATGNVTGGNLTTAGLVSATGNVTGGNLTTAGLVSATGNVTGGNLTTAGAVSSASLAVAGLANLVGTTSAIGVLLSGARERVNITGTGATGTLSINVSTAPIWFYNGTASGNFTVNLNAGTGNQLNTLLGTGEACTFAVLVNNGGTAYYATAVQVDGTGSGVTTEWQGGSAPSAGNASSIDVYTFTVVKTASATYTVLAALTRFA